MKTSKRSFLRILFTLAICVVTLCCFSVTAFAGADDVAQELPEATEEPVTDATPDPTPEATAEPSVTEGTSFTSDGNAVTRDLLYDKTTNKQFIVIETKSGNTFYIIIDYDQLVNEEEELYKTYFLNLVDERDLTDLMDDEDIGAYSCTCTDKCAAGDVNTTCPVCSVNMSECTGKEAMSETPATDTPTDAKPVDAEQSSGGSSLITVLIIALVVAAAGGGYWYFKFGRNKKHDDENLDFYDDEGYEDEPYINEDAETDESPADNSAESEGDDED